MYWASRPQNPKPRERSRKNKKLTLNLFKHLHPTTPAKRTENPIRSCYNASGKVGQSRDREGAVSAPVWACPLG